MDKREVVRHMGREFFVTTQTADEIALHVARRDGYRIAGYEDGTGAPNYPVPAHQYIVLMSPHCVEMCLGIVRTYEEGGYVGYECECVMYVTDYPKIVKIR
jgi:hypothetical protein